MFLQYMVYSITLYMYMYMYTYSVYMHKHTCNSVDTSVSFCIPSFNLLSVARKEFLSACS